MSKIELSFNERAYNKKQQGHEEFKNSKKELVKVIDSYGVEGKELVKASQIYKETAEAIFTQLSKGSNLPESMNKLKFLDLMDVDLAPLSKAVNLYNSLTKHANKPKREEFVTYLSDDNKEEYDNLIEAIDILNKLADKGYIKSKIAIQNAFGNKISVDMHSTKFKFNSLNR